MARVRGVLGVESVAQALVRTVLARALRTPEPATAHGSAVHAGPGPGPRRPGLAAAAAPGWTSGWRKRRKNCRSSLRMTLAEGRLHRGDIAGMEAALAGLQSPALPLFAAARLAQRGQWAEAAAAYAEAYKALRKAHGPPPRRGTLRPAVAVRAGAGRPAHGGRWTAGAQILRRRVGFAHARAVSTAGACGRTPSARGSATTQRTPPSSPIARARTTRPCRPRLLALRLLLAAWLGHRPGDWTDAAVARVLAVLDDGGQWLLADLVRQAAERLGLAAAPSARAPVAPPAVFGSPREDWRDALAAIAALGETRGGSAPPRCPRCSAHHAGQDGSVEEVEPWSCRPARAARPARCRWRG